MKGSATFALAKQTELTFTGTAKKRSRSKKAVKVELTEHYIEALGRNTTLLDDAYFSIKDTLSTVAASEIDAAACDQCGLAWLVFAIQGYHETATGKKLRLYPQARTSMLSELASKHNIGASGPVGDCAGGADDNCDEDGPAGDISTNTGIDSVIGKPPFKQKLLAFLKSNIPHATCDPSLMKRFRRLSPAASALSAEVLSK